MADFMYGPVEDLTRLQANYHDTSMPVILEIKYTFSFMIRDMAGMGWDGTSALESHYELVPQHMKLPFTESDPWCFSLFQRVSHLNLSQQNKVAEADQQSQKLLPC